MKKFLITALFIGLFPMLCFANGQNEVNDQVKELKLFHFKVSQVDQWEQIVKDYKAVEPNVNLVIETVGGAADWSTTLKTKFAAGAGPDIFIVDGPALAMTFSEYLTDLSDQPWVDHVLESAKRPMVFNDKLMGMPFNIEGYGFIYNKEIFRKASIATAPKTLSELREAAQKIQAIGVTPFGNGYSEWWVIGMHLMNIPFAAQADPVAFREALDNGTASIVDNQLFKDFKDLFDLTIEYGNPNSLTTDHNAQMALFNTGQVAMVQQGNWKEAGIYEANPNADIGILPITLNDDPQVSNKVPVGVPFYWVVNNQSNVQEEAKQFLNWMVSSEKGKSYLTDEFGYIPAFDNIDSNLLGGISNDLLEFAANGDTIPWSFTTWPGGMYNEFAEYTQKYVVGKISFDNMLKEMQKSWVKLSK